MNKLSIYLHNPKEWWHSSATFRSSQPKIILMHSCPISGQETRFCCEFQI